MLNDKVGFRPDNIFGFSNRYHLLICSSTSKAR